MWGVTSFGDELTGDFCDGFEAISIGDFGLFYRLAGKIVSRGRFTYRLTWEEIVRLYRLKISRRRMTTSARSCLCDGLGAVLVVEAVEGVAPRHLQRPRRRSFDNNYFSLLRFTLCGNPRCQ
jgi:hypothetical protein